jgi:hypothetical protein
MRGAPSQRFSSPPLGAEREGEVGAATAGSASPASLLANPIDLRVPHLTLPLRPNGAERRTAAMA